MISLRREDLLEAKRNKSKIMKPVNFVLSMYIFLSEKIKLIPNL